MHKIFSVKVLKIIKQSVQYWNKDIQNIYINLKKPEGNFEGIN